MILPLGHDRLTVRRLPWMTLGIIVVNCAVFLATAHDLASFRLLGFVPAHPTPWSYVSSMFTHGDWMHLLGNMYFLYLCGCSIEDLWGRPLYVATYFAGGMASLGLYCFFNPDSHASLIGASGAISAIMGIFFVRCFETELRCLWLDFPIVTTFKVRAGWILFFWFAEQLLLALLFSDISTVAFWSHVGGFVFGAAVATVLSVTGLERAVIAPAVERRLNLVRLHPRLERALSHMERRDYFSAVVDLKVAVRDQPRDPDLCQLLAQCYVFLGKPDQARYWLYRELRLHVERRDRSMIVDAYFELLGASETVPLSPKETHVVASALRSAGYVKAALDVAARAGKAK